MMRHGNIIKFSLFILLTVGLCIQAKKADANELLFWEQNEDGGTWLYEELTSSPDSDSAQDSFQWDDDALGDTNDSLYVKPMQTHTEQCTAQCPLASGGVTCKLTVTAWVIWGGSCTTKTLGKYVSCNAKIKYIEQQNIDKQKTLVKIKRCLSPK